MKGIGRLGILIWLLIIAAGVFVGSQVFPFYYYYYELEGLMEGQAAKASVLKDQEIRRNLLRQIKKTEIPIDDQEDLKIFRVGGKIIIELEYEEVLFVDFGEERVYDLHVFKFHPRVERDL